MSLVLRNFAFLKWLFWVGRYGVSFINMTLSVFGFLALNNSWMGISSTLKRLASHRSSGLAFGLRFKSSLLVLISKLGMEDQLILFMIGGVLRFRW